MAQLQTQDKLIQDKPTRIDLILTIYPRPLQNFSIIETGLSDFHNMFVTVMKSFYRKIQPKITHYHIYENV